MIQYLLYNFEKIKLICIFVKVNRNFKIGKKVKGSNINTNVTSYVAKDENGCTTLFYGNKPHLIESNCGDFWVGKNSIELDEELFKDLDFYNSPIEVDVIIRKKLK